jgi:hypothetical protein
MNEREPSHEWLSDTCGNEDCSKEFYIAPDNSRIDIFEDHPECTYVYTYCPHCEEYFLRLFIMDGDVKDWLDQGFEAHYDKQTPKHVLASYNAIKESIDNRRGEEQESQPEAPVVAYNELTERHERRVRFLGHLLLNDKLTVADFESDGELFI